MRTTLAVCCLALAAPAYADAPSAWVHVRVQEAKQDSRISVNLPISVLQAVVLAAPDKVMTGGHLHVNDNRELKISDLRKAWQALAKAGDARIVDVQDKDDKVSVRRLADKLLVTVDNARQKEQVRIEVPARVVDAFFSGNGEDVNLKAALTQLESLRGDFVKVDDANSSVRIWIDEQP